MTTARRDYYPRVMFAIMLILAALMIASAIRAPVRPVGATTSGAWSCEARPWLLGNRVDTWRGDTGGAAAAFPDGALALVSADVIGRVFHVWMYSAAGGDLFVDVPFSAIETEPGTVFPTGRLDTTGPPTALYDRGKLKVIIREWNGGGNGPAPLARIYTWCGIAP